jgi:hypothetical protein
MSTLFVSKKLFLFALLFIILGVGAYSIFLFFYPTGLYITLKGHSAEIYCVAFSPDGKYIATGSKDQTARIWDFATGIERAMLQGHSGTVLSVAFTPDSKLLVSGSEDGSLKIWETSTGSEMATLSGHARMPVRAVALSHNGHILASGGYDNSICIWDMMNRTEIAVLKGHAHPVSSVAFSPEDILLASRSIDGVTYLWDTKDWSRRKQLGVKHAVLDRILCLSFAPNRNTLATNEFYRSIKLWDVTTTQGECVLEADIDWPICSMAFSPDGKILAGLTILGYRNLLLWDTTSGALLCKRHIWPGTSIAYSPDGKYLASGGHRGELKIWEVSSLLQ